MTMSVNLALLCIALLLVSGTEASSFERAIEFIRLPGFDKFIGAINISFAGDLKAVSSVPHVFESSPKAVMDNYLTAGVHRFAAHVRRLDTAKVDYDESAVRAVIGAYKRYRGVLATALDADAYNRRTGDANVKFWSSLHPTLGCANTERIGFQPDGPRFLCNGGALGYDGRVDVVGFGSNNQWEWEDALLRQDATVETFKINSITTLDCTVNPKTITPPPSCTNVCTFKKLCIGDHDTDTFMRIGSIPSRLGVSKVALLKLDVEGWEFRAVPDWVQQWARGKTDLEVQQVQIEFHRLGWKGEEGHSWNSFLNAHLLFLHFYAMGFVPVQYERNHMDDCCFEYTFVNATWYVQSELKERPYRDFP